jgi:serine/threonine-protein kinase
MTPRRRAAIESEDERTEVDDAAGDRRTVDATPPPLQPIADFELPISIGTLLGDYRVQAKLGAGGMGDVYLGVHEVIGKRAAIKVLKGELCSDTFSVERFIAEARVVNQIGHPNIVDVFAFGQTPDGRSFLVMELLEGETLRERIARGPIGLTEVCAIVQPLVRALAAAHAKGVVHRDLKPDNVFLVAGDRASVKLLDFGIAKLVKSDSMQQTASGALVGTPMYLAPEQARAQTVDHRADIYTLGGMLFELVTGRPPFLAASSFEVVAKHLMEPPEHPSTFAPVPAELDELIVNMLAKAPEARPTLAEVAAVLDRVADPRRPSPLIERESHRSIAVTTKREVPSFPATTLPPRAAPRRRPLPVILLALAVLVTGAVIALALRTTDRAAAPPADAAPAKHAPVISPIEDAALPTVAPADAAPPPADARTPPRTIPPRGVPRTVPHVEPPPPPPPPPPAGSGSSDDEHLLKRGSVGR